MEDLNLHFTGDIHAIGAANNLLSAMLEASILHGNPLGIDPLTVSWRRCVDMNDRALRSVVIGLGGRANGYVRETGFDITAASEVMAIAAVSRDLFDLRKRLGAITVAYTWEGEPVTAEQLKAAGAMAVLLKDAIKPNLVQTLEGQPAFVHCGPFANIAHGNSSLVADLVGLKLGDYVVTESGFGSDMGMEKLLDIVCPAGGIQPAVIVLVATVRALKHHGGDPDGGIDAVERGAPNLARHIGIVKEFGLNAVVAVNRLPGDTDDEIATVRRLALELGAHSAAVNWSFEGGGEGAVELAEAVVAAAEAPSAFEPIYPMDAPIADKIDAIARRVYGADGSYLLPAAQNDIKRFTAQGLDTVPICMAKTHLSLSHDPDAGGSADRIHGARCGPSAPTRAPAGWSRSAGTCRRCRACRRRPQRSTSTSTRAARRSGSSERGGDRRRYPRSCSGVTPSARRTSPPVPLGSEAIATSRSPGVIRSRSAPEASTSAALIARFARGVKGLWRPGGHASSPSPTRFTTSARAASTVTGEIPGPAAQQREQQVLRADVVVLERVRLLLRLDDHLPRVGVEAGEEGLALPVATGASTSRPAHWLRRRRCRAFDDLVDALVRELEHLGDLAERAAGRVQLLDRVVVVDPGVRGLALEVDERLRACPRRPRGSARPASSRLAY